MEILSLETLPGYDSGSLSVLANRALRDFHDDLDDRPEVKKGRKVTIVIEGKPRDVHGQQLETAEVSISVKLSLPNKSTRTNILSNQPQSRGFGFETDTRKAKHLPGQDKLFDDPVEALDDE